MSNCAFGHVVLPTTITSGMNENVVQSIIRSMINFDLGKALATNINKEHRPFFCSNGMWAKGHTALACHAAHCAVQHPQQTHWELASDAVVVTLDHQNHVADLFRAHAA